MYKLQKIDQLYLSSHWFLSPEDECYHLMSYTASQGYDFNSENSLIFNFKKNVSKKGHSDWKYRESAITKIANSLTELDLNSIFPLATYIPIPPSKVKGHPEYNERLIETLSKISNGNLNIKDVIRQKESTVAFHESGNRRNVEIIANNYEIDEESLAEIGDIIIIFDDVISTGAHYIAIKQLLKERFPENRIIGLFVARTTHVED